MSKAKAGEGGVDYERMIINAELLQNLGTDKFIPIIRQASRKEKTPTFLGTRVYADFTNDSQFDAECEKLIRELHEMPIIEKPPLGKNPFSDFEESTGNLDRVKSVSEAYIEASKIIRSGDILEWRKLVKDIRPKVFKALVQWRQDKLDGQKPGSKEQLVQTVDKAVEIVSPLMIVALVGVESGREEFKNQKSFLDDLQNIVGWNPAGYEVWIRLPNALGYVYHSLHGGTCISTSQIDLALSLAQVKIPVAGGTKFFHLWEMSEHRGYALSISGTRGGNSLESWKYLVNAYERWEWLSLIFEDAQEYRASLIAYYMALNIHELASAIAAGREDTLNSISEPYFQIPLTFLYEDYDTTQKAISLLRRNPNSLADLWTGLNVTRKQVESLWENWIDLSEKALIKSLSLNQKALQNLSGLYRYLFKGL